MALSASLIGVTANCEGISSAITVSTAANYDLKIYLLEGDVETKIYQQVDIDEAVPANITITTQALLNSGVNDMYDSGNDELDAIIESITTFNGIFKVEIDDGTDTVQFYSVGTCSIDCCLANLIQANLDCTCTDGDCCEDIKKAEKILILTRAAILDGANGDIVGATEKYNKAVELCGSTPCDCNC